MRCSPAACNGIFDTVRARLFVRVWSWNQEVGKRLTHHFGGHMTAVFAESFHVDLDILVPADLEPEPRERIASSVSRTLAPVIERISTGRDLAQVLDLPAPLPVEIQLQVVDGAIGDGSGVLPVRATLSGPPTQPMVQFDAVADALGDLLYETIQPLPAPADAVEAIGGSPDARVTFDVCFGDEAATGSTGPGSLSQGYCDAGYYSWAKGCSSWPW